jgi:dolichol-phosphate mannosyltransferase
MKLSVVSPVYKAEKMVEELVNRILALRIPGISDIEIVLVEDGSPDRSWDEIVRLAAVHKEIKGIQLSRNFGQHHAIMAGLDHATGEWVVVMDCDLQDLPEEIPAFFEEQRKASSDLVLARRESRSDSFLKKATSSVFYFLFYMLSGIKRDSGIANFGLYHRKVIAAVLASTNAHPFFPFLVQWVGFKKATLNIRHGARHEGQSSYTWSKLVRLALHIIFTTTQRPLKWVINLCFFISGMSILMAGYVFYQKISNGIQVSGYASLMISIWFLTGCVIFTLGIVAIYVGKIQNQTEKKPVYIKREEV